MRKLFILLLIVGSLSTGCSKQEDMLSEAATMVNINSELLDGVYSEKTNNTIEYIYKCEYLKKLDDLEESIRDSYKLYDEESTLRMTEIEEEKFEIWNNELNNIYKVLKSQLNESEFKEVKNKEINWFEYREDRAQKDAKLFEGMDFAQVQYNTSLTKLTKERCYELVNKYLK